MKQRHVCLVGLPGSGKSTIGRHLARRLGVEFFDSDRCIEEEQACSVRALFESVGEARFRELEEAALRNIFLLERGVLVASGGGAILRASNREIMGQSAYVVYLHASAEDLARRLRYDTTRPLLQVNDPLKVMRALYAERDELYREAAGLVVQTGRPSVSALVDVISRGIQVSPAVNSDF